ncbi:MAG: arsenate reductase ArsC [Bdellovibrionales bacterium]|nr:arsenate reductase ArsC [Bdellovibrionales bacterium]
MAEGFMNHLHRDDFKAYSAGLNPSILDPLAVEVMREVGIDISRNLAKKVDDFRDQIFDYVVTVCESDAPECPFLRGAKGNFHQSFGDPPKLAADVGPHFAKLVYYRQVRDEIKCFIESLPTRLVDSCLNSEKTNATNKNS